MTYLGEGRVSLGDQGQGEIIQINFKMNFIIDSCQRFSHTLRVPSTDCFKSIASHKKCIFLKNQLFFGSLFSVMRHNSPALFHLKLYVLQTKRAHQSANFRLATVRIKIHLIPHVIFGTKNQFFFKLCIICTFSSKILYALDERSPSKSKFPDFRLLA